MSETKVEMMKTLTALTFTLILTSAFSSQPPSAAAPSCERLVETLKLPNTKVTSAQTIAAGRFTAPGVSAAAASRAYADLPEFCRVELTLTPSPDSEIKSEVWLPQTGWNGKFQEVGNGAWAGSIQYGALATALQRGYAAASTNAGQFTAFNPFTTTPLLDANWQYGPKFGTALNRFAYTTPREMRVTFGLRF